MRESTNGDRTKRAVTLTGDAAIALRETLGEPAKKWMLARKPAPLTEETYRIVLDPTQQKALREGTQRFAIPGKGERQLAPEGRQDWGVDAGGPVGEGR